MEYLRNNFRPVQDLYNRKVFKSAVKDAWQKDLTEVIGGPHGTEASRGRQQSFHIIFSKFVGWGFSLDGRLVWDCGRFERSLFPLWPLWRIRGKRLQQWQQSPHERLRPWLSDAAYSLLLTSPFSHHKPGLSWWAARLIKVSTQPEWSSTFRKLTQETGKSSEAKTTLIMHPVWDLPIWCMKDNQEMWIGTESQPFVNYQYPLECFSSSTFLINKAIIFVVRHLTESSDHLVNTHKNAPREDHPEWSQETPWYNSSVSADTHLRKAFLVAHYYSSL